MLLRQITQLIYLSIPNSIKEGDTFDLKISLAKPSSEVVLSVAQNSNLQFSGASSFQSLKVTVLQDDDKLNEDTSLAFNTATQILHNR